MKSMVEYYRFSLKIKMSKEERGRGVWMSVIAVLSRILELLFDDNRSRDTKQGFINRFLENVQEEIISLRKHFVH